MSYEGKHPGGRPRKYNTPEEMQTDIDKYFDECKSKDYHPTICGLALALGFISRQSLLDYEGYNQEFFDTIKTAKLQIEEGYERFLIKGKNAAGPIFALKNFDWTDTHSVNVEGNIHQENIDLASDPKKAKEFYKQKLLLIEQAEQAGASIAEG